MDYLPTGRQADYSNYGLPPIIMSKLSKEEVVHIAKLSRLELSEDEKARFGDQLSDVLEYVGQLDEVNTDDVDPLNNVTGLSNVYVTDEVEKSDILHDDIAKNAPEFEGGFFKVPGVFE
ncbi:MAG: Asp-tRNA(Asn)/Glu-tRNA(Gln) amidotransferase subunit GatC [bacterium]|nr:Asp-tRNA(Asn)/Glu-tRNA(Gln) amidotransferase subunit GatC [bacterium]